MTKMPSGCTGDVVLLLARFEVKCPDCSEVNFITHPRHTIHLNVFGLTVIEPWSCHSCGYVGRIVKAHNVTVGRISIPPSGAIRALRRDELPKRDYEAWLAKQMTLGHRTSGDIVKIRVKSSIVPTRRDLDNAESCPERRRHGFFANQGKLRCPICSFPFFNINVQDDQPQEGAIRTTS